MIAPAMPDDRRRRRDEIDLNTLKRSIDLVELVRSRGHEPTRHGSGKWKIRCPFHEDDTASLIMTPAKGLWQCFGCSKAGSAIDFVMLSDNLSTGEAIRALANPGNGHVRTPVEREKPEDEKGRSPRSPRQQTLLNKAAEFYHKTFCQQPEGKAYLKGRGITDAALLESFRVGYANDSIKEALPPDGELLDDLKALGILDAQGREHFRDCVVFPVYDHHGTGNVVGMYGRKIIDGGPYPHLYLPGPHAGVWNHTCARSFKTLLLTESVLDAATLWQAGYKNTLPLYGVNGLTADHLHLFKVNQVETVFLVFDADEAGRNGVAKHMPRLKVEGLEVFTVNLPDGEDPNSFFQTHNAEAFEALLHASQSEPGATQPQPAAAINPELEAATVTERPDGFTLTIQRRSYDVQLVETKPTRIRATIKALTPDRHRFHIDTVDLFSARSRKAFVMDVTTLYHEAEAILTADMNRIVLQSEQHLAVRHDKPEAGLPVIQLTDEARKDGEKFGKRKDLIEAIAQDIDKSGYIGERANALCAYLAMTSRKMDDPLALLIISASGAGKSALQDAVLAFCPEEDLIKVTSLTERALFYKDEMSLKHKVLALEESAGADDAAYAIRNLISQKMLVIESTIKDPVTGRLTTMENRVYGPTAVFQTTTRPDVDPETRSRFLVTSIDESREQTTRILDAQRKARTLDGFRKKLLRSDIHARHHAFQRHLKPLPVFNPFADLLTFTDERLLTRRDQPKYLGLMDTVAFLRQFQKPVKQIVDAGATRDYIEVSLSDVALANELALDILGKTLDELSGPSRRLLLLIDELVHQNAGTRGVQASGVFFTRRELREFTRWSDYQIHHYLTQLVALEYLVPVAGRNGAQYQYRLVWDGQGRDGERFVLGLKSVEQLRKDANLLGFSEHLLD